MSQEVKEGKVAYTWRIEGINSFSQFVFLLLQSLKNLIFGSKLFGKSSFTTIFWKILKNMISLATCLMLKEIKRPFPNI